MDTSPLSLLRRLPVALLALRRVPARRVLWRQLHFSGLEALPLMLLIGIASGIIISGTLHLRFGQNQADSLRLLSLITLSALAPLLTALVLIARSSSAMASELAFMKVQGEVSSLQWQHIHPVDYLMMPRVLGMAIAGMILAINMSLATIFAGSLLTAGSAAIDQLFQLAGTIRPIVLLLTAGKTLLLTMVVACIACLCGLSAQQSYTEIPRAASRAVVYGLISVFVIDGLLTWGLGIND